MSLVAKLLSLVTGCMLDMAVIHRVDFCWLLCKRFFGAFDESLRFFVSRTWWRRQSL